MVYITVWPSTWQGTGVFIAIIGPFFDVVESNLTWRDKLEKAVLDVPLRVQSNLSEPVVSMSKLLRVKEGDTMSINVDDTVDFYVGNQKYFKAEMGEIKGNACIRLTKRLKN